MHLLVGAIVLCLMSPTVSTQMCQDWGKQCFTHSDCCGGCCMKNVCVKSTRNCLLSVDDCEIFYCPPGMSCSLFQMPGCPGCPIIPYCTSWPAA